jgi:hypothetical protein
MHGYLPYTVWQVDSNMKLGEWAGLCKIDQEGKARKVGTNVANFKNIVLGQFCNLIFTLSIMDL